MKILIVENHPMVSEGLKLIFEQDEGVEGIAVAIDGNEALSLTEKLLPDVVVINQHTNGVDGEDVVRRIKKFNINIKTLVITSITSGELLQGIVDAGTDALLSADSEIMTIKNTIKAIAGNLAVIDEKLMNKAKAENGLFSFALTKKEKYIVHSIAAGKTNKEIASECGLKEGTVKNTVSLILKKTGAVSRAQLASMAVRLPLDMSCCEKREKKG